MKRSLLLLCQAIVCLSLNTIAQPTWEWGHTYGSSGNEFPEDMITDNAGNTYVTGVMGDTCYIGSDTLYGSYSASGSAFGHAYIAKYDSSGNVLWATGPEEDTSWSRIYNLVVDDAGNIYGSGYQYDTLNWQGNTYAAYGFIYFIVKLSPQGDIIWLKQMNLAFWPRQIIYHDGRIWMPDYSTSSVTLDTVTISYPSGSDRDLHVFSLDTATGTAISGFRIDLQGTEYTADMTFGNGHLYVAGITNDTIHVGTDTVYVNSGYKAFLVKTDLQGNLKWVNSLYRTSSGASGSEQELKVGPSGNVYCFQEFTGSLDIEDTSITSLGSRDLLLVKISSAGELVYFKQMGSTSTEYVGGMHPMSNGKLVVGGQCSNPFYVNGETKPGISSSRPFIAEFGADGTYLNYVNSTSAGSGFFHRLDETSNNKLVGFGVYQVSVTFGSVSLSGTYRENMVILGSLDSCDVASPNIIAVSGCSSDSVLLKTDVTGFDFLWSTGDTLDSIYVQNDGLYNVLITDSNNCSAYSDWKNVDVGESLKLSIQDSISKCLEDSIWVDASKDGPVYWSTGAFADSIYVSSPQSVYAFDSLPGCVQFTDTLLVKNHPLDTSVTLTYSDTGICPFSSIQVGLTTTYSSYRWMNTLTSATILVNTTNPVYVEVTDIYGCKAHSDTLVPVAYPPVTPVILQNDTTICFGDSLQLTINQSFPNYNWSTNDTSATIWVDQSSGYSVTVTDSNGCMGTSSTVQLTVQSLPIFNLSHIGTNVICDSQLVYLKGLGGNYQYTWNTSQVADSILVSQAGLYSAVATDSIGCQSRSDTVEFKFSNPEAVITSLGPTEFCAGESVTLEGNSGMSSYVWSSGNNTSSVVVSNSQSVTLIVTDSLGCRDTSQSLQITRYPLPPQPVITLSGTTLSTSATGQLQWYLNGNPISGATGNSHVATTNGQYTITVTDGNDCENESDPFSLTWLGISSAGSLNIAIYPNPVKQTLFIQTNGQLQGQLAVYDMNGSLVIQEDEFKNQLDVSALGEGTYLLVIQSDTEILKQVFVKE